jgi:hypothetical protein
MPLDERRWIRVFMFPSLSCAFALKLVGRFKYCGNNSFVSSASTEIFRHGLAYAALCLPGFPIEEIDRCQDHTRRTETALQSVSPAECLLHRMHPSSIGEPFDGRDFRLARLDREHDAGTDRLAVEQDRAGAANAMLAADMDTGHAQDVTQEIRKQGARLGDAAQPRAIDAKLRPLTTSPHTPHCPCLSGGLQCGCRVGP